MDFTFTPDEERFRTDLRAFLRSRLPERWSDRDFMGDVPPDERLAVEAAIRRSLADRRWLAMAWPARFGGLDAPHMQQAIYTDEAAYARMPGSVNAGVTSVGPAIQQFGTDAQRETYLPRIAAGQDA